MDRKVVCFSLSLLTLLYCVVEKSVNTNGQNDIPDIPVKGVVTILELGATSCIPCRMMAPIIARLKEKYKGKASIIFIDIRHHSNLAERFGIQGIPTQIFFDEEGKEILRHFGFMSEKAIIQQLKKMGITASNSKQNYQRYNSGVFFYNS